MTDFTDEKDETILSNIEKFKQNGANLVKEKKFGEAAIQYGEGILLFI